MNAAPLPRQSLFPGSAASANFNPGAASTSHLASLDSALQSLHHTVDVLSHTNALLSHSVADIPRLTTVLTSKRHFDVVTETKVAEAKQRLEEEVRPHLLELMKKGEDGVNKEEAAARRARNKVSQLTTRLEQVLASQPTKLAAASAASAKAAADLEQEERALADEQRQAADLQRVQARKLQLQEDLKELEAEVRRTELELQERSTA